MARVIVLGGCGAVGTVAVKTLAKQDLFDSVVIGDMNAERAKKLCADLGPKVSFTPVNAEDTASVKAAIAGCSVVCNCVGPFYKTVKPIVRAVLESKINYVDVCDDVDVTLELLDWDAEAKRAGITCLIGMGSSPGATNVLARLAYDTLLDETDSVDIFHAHGGEPFEGPGVIGHRFHCMSIDIPMFLDGKMKYVKYFEPDGIALRQKFSFPVLGDDILLYPYPHPEQVTMPRYMKLRQVTNKGTVIPSEYYDLTRDLCQLGLASRDPVKIGGAEIAPYDFAMAYIIREREKMLKAVNFGPQRGCCSVVVKGRKGGKYREYRFHMASKSQALGEGTGIPAAMGTILMMQGKVAGKGITPPEGCVNPMDFIPLLPQVMDMDKKKEGGDSFGGIIIQKVDENGKISNVEM
jgi:saccharopine dehydrogenase (NAD+, L-lysine-forming)